MLYFIDYLGFLTLKIEFPSNHFDQLVKDHFRCVEKGRFKNYLPIIKNEHYYTYIKNADSKFFIKIKKVYLLILDSLFLSLSSIFLVSNNPIKHFPLQEIVALFLTFIAICFITLMVEKRSYLKMR